MLAPYSLVFVRDLGLGLAATCTRAVGEGFASLMAHAWCFRCEPLPSNAEENNRGVEQANESPRIDALTITVREPPAHLGEPLSTAHECQQSARRA